VTDEPSIDTQLTEWVETARDHLEADDPAVVLDLLGVGLVAKLDVLDLADLAATAIMRLVLAEVDAEVEQLRAQLAECRGPAADGPQDADPVGVAAPRRGIEMHRLDQPTAALSGCGRSTRTWTVTTAANAMGRWDSRPCRGCWPGAS
jgi:hypothetical protein